MRTMGRGWICVALTLGCGSCFDESDVDESGAPTTGGPTSMTEPVTSTTGVDTTDPDSSGGGCVAPMADCDGDPSNGCETNLDGSTDHCGQCGEACGPPMFCAAGNCGTECDANIIYVSPDGDDTWSGCAPEQPMRSLNGAIARVAAAGLTGYEIHACQGVYEVPVVLDYPVSLRGSYSCLTFLRTPDFLVDEQNVSEIRAQTEGGTLTISGAVVDASVVVDGWLVDAAGTQDAFSSAVTVTDGASPEIFRIEARGGVATQGGSVGIFVVDGAAPEIHGSVVDGGGAVRGQGQAAQNSIGVWLTESAGAARVHDNVISGGAAQGPVSGSVGLLVRTPAVLAADTAITNNTIDGGTGSCPGTSPCTATVGIAVEPPAGRSQPVEVFANVVDAGRAECADQGLNANCLQVGVSVIAGADAAIDSNRIYGGEVVTPYVFVRGISYAPGTAGRITNNMIHGGTPLLPSGRDYLGIAVNGTGNPATIAHNTIVNAAIGIPDGLAIGVAAGGSPLQLDNNLFVGSDTGDDVALRMETCNYPAVPLQSLSSNAFVNHGPNFVQIWSPAPGPDCTPGQLATTVEEAITVLDTLGGGPLPSPAGNFRLAASCGPDGDCVLLDECPAATSCQQRLFSTWSDGVTELLTGGWRLNADLPCALVQGGTDLTAVLPVDLYGTARTPGVTIGAEELDDCI